MSEDLDENPIHIVDETGSRIKQNVGANPEGVKTALIEGMSQLDNIEKRLKSDSGNVNYKGIDIENAHNAYMDYASGKGSMETAATAMAEDIQTALETGRLTDTETNNLKSVMGELVGDVDSGTNGGDNGGSGQEKNIVGTNYSEIKPTQDNINPQKVAEYAKMLLAGEKLPPVEAIDVTGKGLYIIDGHHRYVASQQTGIPIEIQVVKGQGPIGMPDWSSVKWKTYINESQFWSD